MRNFDELMNSLKAEILRLKTAAPKSSMTMSTVENNIAISTPTSTANGYGYAYITLVSDRPFICQAYFDDAARFQTDHRSWVLAVFFPADGVAVIVAQVMDPSKSGATFTENLTLVSTADVAVQVDYGEI